MNVNGQEFVRERWRVLGVGSVAVESREVDPSISDEEEDVMNVT